MQLQLIFSNEPRFLSSVRAFALESLKQWPLPAQVVEKLGECVVSAADNAIENAYPAGEPGKIQFSLSEDNGKLELTIRDYGLPQDVAELERRLNSPSSATNSVATSWPGADVLDEMHWIGYGREGKAIQFVKWLHDDHIVDKADPSALAPFHENAPLAPQQQYTFRRMQSEEALQVSQLMYRAYGNTYFNDDVYYPDRVAGQNANNTLLSFVAVGAGSQLAGHYALERNQPGPVAEGGQAVVDPAHRGRGLLDKMKDAALAEARRLNLAGVFADAVTVHTMTQQSDLKHGAHLTCVDLAISPSTEQFRNIATTLPQRLTCLLFFEWLESPEPRTIYVPQRHRDIITAIYNNLQCPMSIGQSSPPTGHGTLKVSIEPGGAAFIRADELGADTAHLIRHAKRDIIERSHAEAIYVELPLTNPATPSVAEALEPEGFAFLGIAPCFSLAGDILRMAYLVEPLAREPIKTVDAFTGQLVDYALAQQSRVQADL